MMRSRVASDFGGVVLPEDGAVDSGSLWQGDNDPVEPTPSHDVGPDPTSPTRPGPEPWRAHSSFADGSGSVAGLCGLPVPELRGAHGEEAPFDELTNECFARLTVEFSQTSDLERFGIGNSSQDRFVLRRQ